MRSCTGRIPGRTACRTPPGPCCCLATPISHDGRATRCSPSSEAVSHPLTRARALVMSAIFHYFRREPDAVRERIEAAMALATEKGFSYWLTHGPILQGWLLSREGRPDEAIVRIREGLAGFLAMGAKLTRTWQLGLLATTCGSLDRADEGLGILDEAFELVEKNGERMYEPELHRLRGELLLRCSLDRGDGGPDLLSARARDRPPAGGALVGAPGRDESRSPVAGTGSAGAGARDHRVGLRVVHGRLRHARPPGGQRPARRPHCRASAYAAQSSAIGVRSDGASNTSRPGRGHERHRSRERPGRRPQCDEDAPVGPQLHPVLGERGAEKVTADLLEPGAIVWGHPDVGMETLPSQPHGGALSRTQLASERAHHVKCRLRVRQGDPVAL